MQPRLALTIGAVFNIVLGLPLVIAPAQIMAGLGLGDVAVFALVQARDTGTVLIGLGIINLLARDAIGPPLRGLLWGNIFIRIAAMAVNSWELATGQIPGSVGAAYPFLVAVNVALIIVFALALRRARRPNV